MSRRSDAFLPDYETFDSDDGVRLVATPGATGGDAVFSILEGHGDRMWLSSLYGVPIVTFANTGQVRCVTTGGLRNALPANVQVPDLRAPPAAYRPLGSVTDVGQAFMLIGRRHVAFVAGRCLTDAIWADKIAPHTQGAMVSASELGFGELIAASGWASANRAVIVGTDVNQPDRVGVVVVRVEFNSGQPTVSLNGSTINWLGASESSGEWNGGVVHARNLTQPNIIVTRGAQLWRAEVLDHGVQLDKMYELKSSPPQWSRIVTSRNDRHNSLFMLVGRSSGDGWDGGITVPVLENWILERSEGRIAPSRMLGGADLASATVITAGSQRIAALHLAREDGTIEFHDVANPSAASWGAVRASTGTKVITLAVGHDYVAALASFMNNESICYAPIKRGPDHVYQSGPECGAAGRYDRVEMVACPTVVAVLRRTGVRTTVQLYTVERGGPQAAAERPPWGTSTTDDKPKSADNKSWSNGW